MAPLQKAFCLFWGSGLLQQTSACANHRTSSWQDLSQRLFLCQPRHPQTEPQTASSASRWPEWAALCYLHGPVETSAPVSPIRPHSVCIPGSPKSKLTFAPDLRQLHCASYPQAHASPATLRSCPLNKQLCAGPSQGIPIGLPLFASWQFQVGYPWHTANI